MLNFKSWRWCFKSLLFNQISIFLKFFISLSIVIFTKFFWQFFFQFYFIINNKESRLTPTFWTILLFNVAKKFDSFNFKLILNWPIIINFTLGNKNSNPNNFPPIVQSILLLFILVILTIKMFYLLIHFCMALDFLDSPEMNQ